MTDIMYYRFMTLEKMIETEPSAEEMPVSRQIDIYELGDILKNPANIKLLNDARTQAVVDGDSALMFRISNIQGLGEAWVSETEQKVKDAVHAFEVGIISKISGQSTDANSGFIRVELTVNGENGLKSVYYEINPFKASGGYKPVIYDLTEMVLSG